MKILREFGWQIFLLCLSLVIYLGLWYALSISPHLQQLIKNEEDRLEKRYRAVAEKMLKASDKQKAAWLRPSRGKGEAWHKTIKVDSHYWGFVPQPNDRVLVWVMVGDVDSPSQEVYVQERAALPSLDLKRIVRWGGLGLFVFLSFLTWISLRSLCFYAKSRDDFMAAAVHDLNTPLIGLRFLIGRDDDEARVLNERLIRLVANVRDFLRLGGRRKKPEQQTVDLTSAYEEAYALFRDDFRDLFEERDIPIVCEENLPLVVADELLTIQIIWNLLGNELKYAAPYGPVAVEFKSREKFVDLIIRDEGQGLSPQEMKRIFKRYYRARRGMASGKGGFGIGLCTSREFARAMGGELSVRANSPRGCVFIFSLPQAT